MKPYRKPGYPGWYVKLVLGGTRKRVGLGTTDETTARRIVAWYEQRVADRDSALLARLASGAVSLVDAYDHRADLAAFLATQDDRPLLPLYVEWAKKAVPKYVTQVGCYLDGLGNEPRLSAFSKATVSAFLGGLTCSGSTVNRYRAALSVFGAWLEERELVEYNIVRKVKRAKANPVPFQYLRPEAYRALVDAASPKWRPVFALLYGTGMEISAALRARRRDVDPERRTVYAHGTKTETRSRECAVDGWAWEIVWAHAKTLLPDALLFPPTAAGAQGKGAGQAGYSPAQANRQHHDLLTRKGHAPMRLHNTRHSFAVAARRRGESDAWIAGQLGHKNTIMVQRTYGRFTPDAVDDQKARREA